TAVLDYRVESCLETAIRVYLEGQYNLIARDFSSAGDIPVSYADVKARISEDDEWNRVVIFLKSL
ncbi:MAG: hypothetical protein ACRDN0_13010, partial [Trebonia sp.]